MDVEGKIGPFKGGDGTKQQIRLGATSEVATTDAHARYYEAVLRGNVFTASNVAAQAVSVALTTTYTGLCISNPLGNNKNLVMLGCQYALSVAPAAIASLHLLVGYSSTTNVTHGTPLASPGIINAFINNTSGSTASVAKADSAATTVNPVYGLSMGSGFTAGALYGTTPSWIDLGGIYVLPPGAWIAWGALTAVTGFGSFAWEEVPI